MLPLTRHNTLDLSTVLCLLRVCKEMINVLHESILAYISSLMTQRLTWRQETDQSMNVACMTWSTIEHYERNGTQFLTRYIMYCLLDEHYQTHEHLSNCVSLLHFAYLQGVYAREYVYRHGHHLWVDRTLEMADFQFSSLRDVFYFRPDSKRAIHLYRAHEVAIRIPMPFEELKRLAYQVYGYSEADIVSILAIGTKGRDILFNMLSEHYDTNVIETRRPRLNDRLRDLLVMCDGTRHLITAPQLDDFRAHCFRMSGMTCEEATCAYLLITRREAHTDALLDPRRFRIPSHVKCELTCKSEHAVKWRHLLEW